VHVGSAADRPQLQRPVMMDSNGPGTELYVLDDSGVLHEYRVLEKSISEYGRAGLPADFVPADMSFLRSDAPPSLLIAGTQSGRGAVIRLSLDHGIVATWNLQNICSGVDSDPSGGTAYVATSDSNEIYWLNPRGRQINRVTEIPEASKLGPLALDEKREQVYVADVANGQVYQYSVKAKKSNVVARVSTPTALVFDSETDRLFIADPGQGAIFVVDTRATKPVAVRFASLRSPYGMTVLSEGRVAVADYSANSILVFSGSGELLFRFPASQ
jgi:DNA-binding beta-propeller fold protein YncE